MLRRIVVDCLLVATALVAPWWLTLMAGLAALLYFNDFWELFLIGLIVDSLYNAPIAGMFGFQFMATATAFILFVIVTPLKRQLRIYR